MDYTDVLRRLAINDRRLGRRRHRRGPTSRSSIRRRWRWSGWPRWSRSAARSRRTAPTPTPRSMRARASRRSSTSWSASSRSSGCRVWSRPPRAWRWRSGYDIDEALESQSDGLTGGSLAAEQADRGRLLHRVVARGDAQLAVDRGDLRADGVAGDEQPLADLADRQVRLQVRQQPQLGRGERRSARRPRPAALDVTISRNSDTSSTSTPRSGRWQQDVVDLAQQVAGGRVVAARQYTLASCSRPRTARKGSTNVQDGRARIARVSCRSASSRSPSVQRKAGRHGEREHARGVVVHPVLVDDREGPSDALGRLVPPPAIHRQQRQLGLAVDDRVGVAELGPDRGRLGEQRQLARSTSPASRCACASRRSAVSRHGLHAGSWATARLASSIICSGPAAHMTARSMARAESNDAVPSSGTRSNDARVRRSRPTVPPPAVCPVSTATQPASTRQRRVRLDGGVAERRQPPLHGRHAGPRCRSAAPARSPAGRTGPARSCSAGAPGPAPAIRSPRTSRPRAGAASRSPRARRAAARRAGTRGTARGSGTTRAGGRAGQERVRRLEAAQPVLAAGLAEQRVAQRGAQLVEHRRAPQEPLRRLRAAASATRGTGSRPRTGRHRRPSSASPRLSRAISAAR